MSIFFSLNAYNSTACGRILKISMPERFQMIGKTVQVHRDLFLTVLWSLGKSPLLDANNSVESSIMRLTVCHIRCFLLSKDAFTPNLAEFQDVTDSERFKTSSVFACFEAF